MDDWMNVPMTNKWLNKCTNVWVKGRMVEWMDECKWIKEWMGGWINELIAKYVNE